MADENKKKQAIALQYNPGDEAPTIVASGMGIVADKIIEKQKKAMFRFTRIPNLPTHFPSLK